MPDEEGEESGKGGSVGDTMHHAAEVLFGSMLPGGSNKDDDDED